MALMWHVYYLFLAGFINAFELFDKMRSYDSIADGGTDIPLSYGFKVLAYGLLVGSVNYLAGLVVNTYQ